jgi:hypothetical protein
VGWPPLAQAATPYAAILFRLVVPKEQELDFATVGNLAYQLVDTAWIRGHGYHYGRPASELQLE